MRFSALSPILSLLSLTLAQSSTIVDGKIHKVDVGEDGKLVFNPDSITAAIGDFVEWHFYAPTHSVNQAAFNSPCAPITDAFSSGSITTTTGENAKVFRILVNSTDPLWYYCGFPGHCQTGMVGVINPPSDETVQQFAAAAASAPFVTEPTTVNGGVVGPAAVQASSSTTQSSVVQASTSSTQGSAVQTSTSSTQSTATPSFTQTSGIDSRGGIQWAMFGITGLVAGLFGSLIV